jgi:pSer/pThr/pTyr-binding forkhead associated (FHA) protein
MSSKRKGAESQIDWADIGSTHPHLCLEYTTDSQRKSVVLHGGAAIIGRGTHLRLAFSEGTVSQSHAIVELDSKKRQWKIKDMGSSHGTEVNGKAVSTKRATFLNDGDKIILSDEIDVMLKVWLLVRPVLCVVSVQRSPTGAM